MSRYGLVYPNGYQRRFKRFRVQFMQNENDGLCQQLLNQRFSLSECRARRYVQYFSYALSLYVVFYSPSLEPDPRCSTCIVSRHHIFITWRVIDDGTNQRNLSLTLPLWSHQTNQTRIDLERSGKIDMHVPFTLSLGFSFVFPHHLESVRS